MTRVGFLVAVAAMVLAAGLDLAQAGSQSWMSGVSLRPPPPVRRLALDARGYAENKPQHPEATGDDVAMNNNTAAQDTTALGKRWLVTSALEYDDYGGPWKYAVILYCYESLEAEQELDEYFQQAIRLWTDHLPSAFKMERLEGVDSGAECLAYYEDERSDPILLVRHTPGSLSSTVGHVPMDKNRRARINLTTLPTIGARDVVVNMAHEIGHVWGLHHEHQNPYFWSGAANSEFLGDDPDDAPFQLSQFNCEALVDYDDAVVRAAAEGITPASMCSSQRSAALARFSARDWLPLHKNRISSQVDVTDDDTFEDIDWESIMLYPSRGGGAPGGPGGPGDDDRMLVMSGLIEGQFREWTANMEPSGKDLEGLKELYEDILDEAEAGDLDDLKMPLETDHTQHAKFIRQVKALLCS